MGLGGVSGFQVCLWPALTAEHLALDMAAVFLVVSSWPYPQRCIASWYCVPWLGIP